MLERIVTAPTATTSFGRCRLSGLNTPRIEPHKFLPACATAGERDGQHRTSCCAAQVYDGFRQWRKCRRTNRRIFARPPKIRGKGHRPRNGPVDEPSCSAILGRGERETLTR